MRDDTVIAEYRERRAWMEGQLGVNVSRVSELTGALRWGRVSDEVAAGDPGLPELSGTEVTARARWVLDQQDSAVVPSRGTRAVIGVLQTLEFPAAAGLARTNIDSTQAELFTSSFFSVGERHRLFVVTSGGTSFGDHPLPTRQFTVGYPFVLDAFGIGERRGDHYGVVSVGGLRRVARLPDFLGGPVFRRTLAPERIGVQL